MNVCTGWNSDIGGDWARLVRVSHCGYGWDTQGQVFRPGANVAIIEEPFSIWRLLRSWFSRTMPAERAVQPGDDAAEDERAEPPRRDQLLDARSKVQRQIELLEYSTNHSRGGPSQNPMLIAELQRTLEQIEADLLDQQAEEPARPDASTGADDRESLEATNLGDPSVLSGFNHSVTNCARAEDGALWVEHLLVCNQCVGGDMFSIISFPKVAPDPSPYAGVAPGETVHLPPWSVRCIECGDEEMIFDPRSAGRDRVLNGVSGDARNPDEPTDETGATTVYVSLIYHAEFDELKGLATKAHVPRADLFDAVHIRGAAPNGETAFEEWHACS